LTSRLNGLNATLTGFPPLFWDKHVGAVRIESGAAVDLSRSDLSITQ
jgi:hypothetical protein